MHRTDQSRNPESNKAPLNLFLRPAGYIEYGRNEQATESLAPFSCQVVALVRQDPERLQQRVSQER